MSNYNVPHSRYQPIFREQIEAKGFRDLYLFDRDGHLVYTTKKGDDFAMGFAEGAGVYADTALGRLFRKTLAEGVPDQVEFEDFSNYGAIAESPVAFFAAPGGRSLISARPNAASTVRPAESMAALGK